MIQAQNGDTVKVHYNARLEDGTVFESSFKDKPLEFKIGNSEVFPRFEQTVIGMAPGDIRKVDIPAADAYGLHNKKMVTQIKREFLPGHIKPEVGQQLKIPQDDGDSIVVVITAVSDTMVTLDGNHPLAGRDLKFDIQLVEIVQKALL